MCAGFLHIPKGRAPSAGEEMFQGWGLKSWSRGSDPGMWCSRRLQGHWQEHPLEERSRKKPSRMNTKKASQVYQAPSESGQHII